MELLRPGFDRIRQNTPERINNKIDAQTRDNIIKYSSDGEQAVRKRIRQLDREWDIDRAVILWASGVLSIGVFLATRVNRKWLALPGVVAGFLGYHAIKGWCPPVSLFRRLKFRSRKEIDAERYALIQKLKDKSL